MRVRTFLAMSIVGTFGAGIYACGGDSVSNPADAGADTSVADTSLPDTSVPDAADATPPCAIPGNLQDLLKVDASSVDAAGVNLQACFDCLTAPSPGGCGDSIAQCNANCECKTGVVTFAACVGGGGKIQTCGAQLILGASPQAQAIATGLLQCAQASCSAQCLPSDGGAPPKDAGPG